MSKKKIRPKLQQIPLDSLPHGARRLAVVFHRYYARLYWSNVVVRLATETQLIVQMNDRINVARLARLQEMADCLVEVQPIAPSYYHIMMWENAPKSTTPDYPDDEAPLGGAIIWHRPFAYHQPAQDE